MELEEQKPKVFLLDLEREIKTEPVDVLEKVKEKLLEEEDCFELLVPKRETEFSSENFKEEPIDEEDYSELIIPKQETSEFLENVKEEPIDEEYFDQIIPKQDFSELIIPKRETEGSLENVKEEPIDEEDYSELLVTKHEEVIESSASYISKNSVQKFYIETQEDVPNLDIEQRKKSSVKCHRCSVCLEKGSRQNMKYVTIEEDKLVIMIGCIFNGTYTLEQARLFMSERKISTSRVYICYVHFTEAINQIYDLFKIKNLDEIVSCSSELMNNLMVTVNNIYPQIGTAPLSDIIYHFVRRNISRKRRCSTNGKQSKMHRNNRCSVCTQNESSQNMKFVTMKDDKLVIMVGCVLRGDYTHEQAYSLISQKKRFRGICHVDIFEALNAIYKALDIKHPHEISSCSVELMTKLMITVNKLCPELEPCQFRISLKNFFTRNKHFIQILSDLKL